MSKLLIISDIHNKWQKAQQLIDSVEFDRCILLGDVFDDFNDFPEDARQSAIWLRDKIFPDNRFTLLCGNHDLAYVFSYNQNAWCSGYSDAKRKAIFSVLSYDEIINRVKFFHEEAGFLFSHAGITNAVWKEMQMAEPDGVKLLDVLPKWVKRSFDGVRTLTAMPLFAAGWSRGGRQQHGGILWADWSEFSPVSGVNQIVGHTPHDVPEITVKLASGAVKHYNAIEWAYNKEALKAKQLQSINFALDTHLNHFAIITDGDVEIWDWNTMLPIREGTIITSETGSPFVPERQLHQPDYGVFRFTNPAGKSEIITGRELCQFEQFFLVNSSNVMAIIARKLKDGYKVAFVRRKLKMRGQPDSEKLPIVHDEHTAQLMRWLEAAAAEDASTDQPPTTTDQ